jgi:hypothetical protein
MLCIIFSRQVVPRQVIHFSMLPGIFKGKKKKSKKKQTFLPALLE